MVAQAVVGVSIRLLHPYDDNIGAQSLPRWKVCQLLRFYRCEGIAARVTRESLLIAAVLHLKLYTARAVLVKSLARERADCAAAFILERVAVEVVREYRFVSCMLTRALLFESWESFGSLVCRFSAASTRLHGWRCHSRAVADWCVGRVVDWLSE